MLDRRGGLGSVAVSLQLSPTLRRQLECPAATTKESRPSGPLARWSARRAVADKSGATQAVERSERQRAGHNQRHVSQNVPPAPKEKPCTGGAEGTQAEITLSEANVIVLAQSAQRLKDQILARHTPKGAGVSPLISVPVARIRLNTDLHLSEILLGMIDGAGAEMTFALPPEVARALAERLPVRLAEIEKAKPTKQ